jgi:hypothetical protein
MKQAAEQPSQQQHSGNADGRVEEPSFSRVDDLAQIHSKPESDDRQLQQETGEVPAFEVIGMDKSEAIAEPDNQCQRRRYNPGCNQY